MPLPSQRNTPAIEDRILKDAEVKFGRLTGMRTVFEHNHWWLLVEEENSDEQETIYDVVDTDMGFDFEAV